MTITLEVKTEEEIKIPTQPKLKLPPSSQKKKTRAEGSEVCVCLDGRKDHSKINVWVYSLGARRLTPDMAGMKRYRFDEWELDSLSETVLLKLRPYYQMVSWKPSSEVYIHVYQFEEQRLINICEKIIDLQREH